MRPSSAVFSLILILLLAAPASADPAAPATTRSDYRTRPIHLNLDLDLRKGEIETLPQALKLEGGAFKRSASGSRSDGQTVNLEGHSYWSLGNDSSYDSETHVGVFDLGGKLSLTRSGTSGQPPTLTAHAVESPSFTLVRGETWDGNREHPHATGDVMFLTTRYVHSSDETMKTKHSGVELSIVDLSGHLAGKFGNSGVGVELCGTAKLLDFIIGKNEIQGDRSWGSTTPLAFSACAAVKAGPVQLRNTTALGWNVGGSRERVSVNSRGVEEKENLSAFNRTFSNATLAQVSLRDVKVGLSYTYSRDHSENALVTAQTDATTHLFQAGVAY